MILDVIDNASRYHALHPAFKDAFTWLDSQTISKLPNGKTVIDGERLYVNVIRDAGRGTAAARYETHRRYIDIQYMAEGADLMGWCHCTSSLNALGYDQVKDIEFFTDPPRIWVPVPERHFAIFFPEDAHAPMAGTGPMVKVVVKVAV